MAEQKERGRGTLDNVAFLFVKIQEPGRKYQSELRAYSATAIMDKATATAFSKEFPNKKVTPLDNESFVEKYKIDVPFPEAAVQYVTSFSTDELNKKGEPIPDFARPRVMIETPDGKTFDATQKVLVGNGSRGKLHYAWYATKFGKGINLAGITVTKLVKYERPASDYIDMTALQEIPDDFDFDSIAIEPTVQASVEKKVEEAPKTETPAPSVEDEALPF